MVNDVGVSDRVAVDGDNPDDLPPLAMEDHVCQNCGLSYQEISIETARQVIQSIPTKVREAVFAIPSEIWRERLRPGGWSVAEYLCHVRDVYSTYTIRLHRARTEDRPALEPMFNDLRARRFRYNESDVHAVLDELTATAAGFCEEIDRTGSEHWNRAVTRLPTETRTARWLVRQAMHEGRHHLDDIHDTGEALIPRGLMVQAAPESVRDQDLHGARFDHVRLRDATFTDVQITGASLHDINLTGLEIRGALLNGSRLRGGELANVEISGELRNVVMNGVDIAPLVDAELNRRMPERAKMRPDDSDGFREAWGILERLWEGTVARATAFPESELHRSVNDEWSFIQTLRHLDFASAAWVGRMILGNPYPWHHLDLPWDVSSRFRARLPPGWGEIPWDREARPSLGEVLEIRHERQAMVRQVMAALTDDQLASHVTCTEPGWPQLENVPFKECLRIVVNEEWEHRLYAERDLSALENFGSEGSPNV
jgi:uncharacterized damage-inducible protein DinB